MIKVEVRLFANFREGREKRLIMEFSENTRISMVLDKLNIREEEVSILLLNGIDGSSDRKLREGDIIALFPPVGGG